MGYATPASPVGPFVVERPKVLYNNMTKKFVLWFHLDNVPLPHSTPPPPPPLPIAVVLQPWRPFACPLPHS